MGIKQLNKYLIDNCSKKSIKKIELKQLKKQKIVIDTSIYLYKFINENRLIENMDNFISILQKYEIEPIFIFDGKPPPEKKELLQKRKIEKKDAELKYNELKQMMENMGSIDKKKEILLQMENLKNQFIRIKDEDIQKVKELMDKRRVIYYNSIIEADQLCAYMVKKQKVDICVSDDMDMFLYGCPFILRNINLINHTAILYNVSSILNDLKMNEQNFREIMVISGTDYNITLETNLYETMKWYNEYNKYLFEDKDLNNKKGFYEWLLTNTIYITNYELLKKTYNMFIIENYNFENFIDIKKINKNKKTK